MSKGNMGMAKWLVSLAVVALLASATFAQEERKPPAPGEPPALRERWVPGKQTTFTERSPHSAVSAQCVRIGWSFQSIQSGDKEKDYDLKNETFQLYEPQAYDGSEPYGLFVWISAGPGGQLAPSWLEAMAQRKIIAIGADNSGNSRAPWIRFGLALDAAYNVAKQYKIDPRRVYVSGGSGGGRCSSMLGVAYPDVFQGGFYMIGCNYFRGLIPPGHPNERWGPDYFKPGSKLLALATKRSRHVLLTGDGDMNREQTKVIYAGMLEDGFKHVTYIEIPGLGHQVPNRAWFEKGLDLLEPTEPEEPVKVVAHKAAAQKPPAEPAKAPVARAETPEPTEADRLLSSAKLYASNKRYDGARTRLKKLIETYPDSPAAVEGKKLLKEIDGK